MQPLNVVFMGTPEIASESMEHILELQKLNKVDLKSVYTKPPAWNNKKKAHTASPVALLAETRNIDIRTPASLKNNDEEINFLKNLDLDLIVAVAFGIILPPEVLAIPRFGALNLHPSLLPDLRGPSPIHYAVLKRLRHSGVSIMVMDSGLDTGPVAAQQRFEVGKDEYYGSLYEKASAAGASLLSGVIESVFKFRFDVRASAFPQRAAGAGTASGHFYTASRLIGRRETELDFFAEDPLEIYAKVRAFEKEGGAFFIFRNKNIKLLEAAIAINPAEFGADRKNNTPDKTAGPFYEYSDYCDYSLCNTGINGENLKNGSIPSGTVVAADKTGLIISTAKKGAYIRLIKLKPEGKNVINYLDFINGFRLKPGESICR